MGGIDLIFPHHTNEIAQSEAAHEKKFCNYWVHNAHLIVNGEKMSKSLGNFFTLRDLFDKGYDKKAIRYELMSTNYRQKLDFREDKLEEVKEILQKFKELFIKLDNITGEIESKTTEKIINKAKTDFEKTMDDDLNIAGALSAIFILIREINKLIDSDNLGKKDAEKVKETLLKFDEVLGVMNYKKEDIPMEVTQLAEKRLAAKNEKNWDEADKLRDEIKENGYQIDDTKDGFILKKIS